MGKIGYAAAAVTVPRLKDDDPASAASKAIQVAINKAARSICGKKLLDKVPTSELLATSGLPSYNRLVVKSVALEAWKAYHSNDGPGGSRNPLGTIIFGSDNCTVGEDKPRHTRATNSGCINPPLPMAAPTLAHNVYRVWNSCRPLREARTLAEAKTAASTFARLAPQ